MFPDLRAKEKNNNKTNVKPSWFWSPRRSLSFGILCKRPNNLRRLDFIIPLMLGESHSCCNSWLIQVPQISPAVKCYSASSTKDNSPVDVNWSIVWRYYGGSQLNEEVDYLKDVVKDANWRSNRWSSSVHNHYFNPCLIYLQTSFICNFNNVRKHLV